MARSSKPRLLARLRRFATRALSTFGGLFGAPTASGYKAGLLNRLTQDWVMLPLSANQEIRWNLRAVRARARELCRDNGFAKRFLQLAAANVIGARGIRLEAQVRDLTGAPSEGVNTQIEAAWEEWGHAENCSADGRQSWTELQRSIVKAMAQDGEAIVHHLRYFPNAYGYAVELIDPDRLDFLYNREPDTETGNRIRFGVEVDPWGRPVAYHIWKHHPSEFEYERDNERVRIPAADITHLYLADRVNQWRGISWFHAIMLALKMYDGYAEAEVVAARTAAAKMWFIKTDAETYGPDAVPGEKVQMEAEPGLFERLYPGEEVQQIDPQHPTTAFEAFTKAVLKGVSAGLSVTYASLTHDLAEANYSSLRAGLLPERDHWRMIQDYLIEHCHRRIYEEWLAMAVLTGQVKIGMRNLATAKQVRWVPRGWEWVDPLNEMRAGIMGIESGLISRTEIVGQRGNDIGEVFADLAAEQKLAAENGIDLATKLVTAPPSATSPAPGEQGGADGESPDGDEAPAAAAGGSGRHLVALRRLRP